MPDSLPTASIIIIGNEILSGRTQDKNVNYIAKALGEMGIKLLEVRVIADLEEMIIETTNELRHKYDYVFTTGGIGPTHDDITASSIAKAFGVEMILDDKVVEDLSAYYKCKPEELSSSRLKMAKFPAGYEAIDNHVSSAPGFKLENVYVMAGIPNIMQVMFENARLHLKGGKKIQSMEVSAYVSESKIADFLTDLQNKYPEVDIGSYPFVQDGKFATSLVMRSTNTYKLEQVNKEMLLGIAGFGEIM